MNEFLFFVTILINFSGILFAFKLFGKPGLFVWIGIATIIANIEVSKCVDMFGMSLTLGNVIYGTTFLATDILSELYGGKEARKGVLVGFFCLITFTILTQVNILFVPNSSDFVSEHLSVIFGLIPRLCVASVVTYLISNTLDTYIYDFIRTRFPKQLWLRNNGSTLTSQFVDSFLFTVLAFAGQFDWLTIIELSLTTYAVKVIIALCDTPFLYAARKMKRKCENGGATE